MKQRQLGFTLLELLVALAVFALVSVMAYGGLQSVLTAKQRTDIQAARMVAVQRTILLLTRDVEQWVDRGIRDEFGDSQPALRGSNSSPIVLELTRDGWPNPTGQTRSTLQRVGYRLEDGTLIREAWTVLDRAQESTPYRAALLENVRVFGVRFLDQSRQWQEFWPPQGETASGTVPVALEVTLELEDWGKITRLYRVPGA